MSEVQKLPHGLSLTERKKLTMTGVQEVVSFDEHQVILKTALGILTVQGSDLQLKQLSPEGGAVAVEGQIVALFYEQPRQGGWLSRLLG